MLKKLRRHGVKCASFADGRLVSVEFFPYESYFVDNDGAKVKGKSPATGTPPTNDAGDLPDTFRQTVLEVGNLPDIKMDRSELLKPPSDKD